jgi:outer membrane protein assembly factor BamB
LLTPLAGGADWATWRGPAHTGISAEQGWLAPSATVKIVWTANVGKGYSSMAVAGGKIYTAGNAENADTVYCLDATQGTVLWKYSYPCPAGGGGYAGPRAMPVVDGQAVYMFSSAGDLICLEAATGEVRWKVQLKQDWGIKPPSWGYASSPLVVGDLVLLNAGDHGVAVNKKTGAKVWESGGNGGSYASVVSWPSGGKALLAVFAAKALRGADAATGDLLWEFPWKTSYDVHAADPVVVSPDQLFITSGYGRGGALLRVTATNAVALWENRNLSAHFSSPVLWQDCLYGIDGNAGGGALKCLDVGSGAVKWSQATGFGSLILSDGKLIVLNEKGELSVVEASPLAYRELLRGRVMVARFWTAPVLADKRIYCRSDAGDVVCVNLAGE